MGRPLRPAPRGPLRSRDGRDDLRDRLAGVAPGGMDRGPRLPLHALDLPHRRHRLRGGAALLLPDGPRLGLARRFIGSGEEGRSELGTPRPAGRRRDGMQVHGPGLGGDPLRIAGDRGRDSPSQPGSAARLRRGLGRRDGSLADQERRRHRRPGLSAGIPVLPRPGMGRRHAGEVAGRARPARLLMEGTRRVDRRHRRPVGLAIAPVCGVRARSHCSDPARDGWRGSSGASPPTSS